MTVEKYAKQEFMINGVKREAWIYHPIKSDAIKSTPLPIVFYFHGYSGYVKDILNDTWSKKEGKNFLTNNFYEYAEKNNFILVYPQGSIDALKLPHWNFMEETKNNKSSAEDFLFVKTILDDLKNDIDVERIYCMGFSNGAALCYALANTKLLNPYKINSIASVGFTLPSVIKPNEKLYNVSMLIIHGMKDTFTETIDKDLEKMKWDEKNKFSINNEGDYKINYEFAGKNNNFIYTEKYIKEKNIFLKHFKIKNVGHIWPNFFYNKLNTNETIIDFFELLKDNTDHSHKTNQKKTEQLDKKISYNQIFLLLKNN